MTDASAIDTLLKQLQKETPNCGGEYHFSKVLLDYRGDIKESIKAYMRQFSPYQHPFYTDEATGHKTYLKELDPENLVLENIENLTVYVDEKLQYWSTHRTGLDCREQVTPHYEAAASAFKAALFHFLSQEPFRSAYVISGVDTWSCFGGDHFNDDTLIQTANGFYILHFGWSS